jgi:hypothetical protein
MIIGLCGAAGSGKDTAGAAIIHGIRDYEKLSFAAPMKGFLCQLFGWEMYQWESLEWKERPNPSANGRTPRQVAQWFGTDFIRERIDTDFWVKRAMIGMRGMRRVVTDVRFPNEARAIRDNDGILLYVRCIGREVATDHAGHQSEAWLPWLKEFADCEIAAEFGRIDELKEAAVNVALNYLEGNTPRFDPSEAYQSELDELESRIASTL